VYLSSCSEALLHVFEICGWPCFRKCLLDKIISETVLTSQHLLYRVLEIEKNSAGELTNDMKKKKKKWVGEAANFWVACLEDQKPPSYPGLEITPDLQNRRHC
jgi:hypothetical protein